MVRRKKIELNSLRSLINAYPFYCYWCILKSVANSFCILVNAFLLHSSMGPCCFVQLEPFLWLPCGFWSMLLFRLDFGLRHQWRCPRCSEYPLAWQLLQLPGLVAATKTVTATTATRIASASTTFLLLWWAPTTSWQDGDHGRRCYHRKAYRRTAASAMYPCCWCWCSCNCCNYCCWQQYE